METYRSHLNTHIYPAFGDRRVGSLARTDMKSFQRRLGHATIAETFDTYGHPFPDDEDLGRGAIDAKIEKDLAEQSRNKKEA